MNRKLVWKKWQNPLNIPEDDDEEDDDELSPWEKKERGHSIKAIAGPFGIMPVGNANSIEKEFNLWVGHTNFPIDRISQTQIINTYGVEAYNIFSPYRFRIAVARLYKGKTVRREICVKLGIEGYEQEKPAIKDVTINNMKEVLNSQYKYWAICVTENKPMVVIGDDNLNVVKSQLPTLTCDDIYKNF